MITRYVRDNTGRRVGYLIGTDEGIGWSKHHRTLDKFDRKLGRDLAIARAKRGFSFVGDDTTLSGLVALDPVSGDRLELHSTVAQALPNFVAEYLRYFKDTSILRVGRN